MADNPFYYWWHPTPEEPWRMLPTRARQMRSYLRDHNLWRLMTAIVVASRPVVKKGKGEE